VLNDIGVDADQKNSIAGSDLPLRTVLAALASILRDSTGRFEATSDRITQLVVARETGNGVDIIVALQEFDRLRQDFDAIESILAGCAQAIDRPDGSQTGHPLRDGVGLREEAEGHLRGQRGRTGQAELAGFGYLGHIVLHAQKLALKQYRYCRSFGWRGELS